MGWFDFWRKKPEAMADAVSLPVKAGFFQAPDGSESTAILNKAGGLGSPKHLNREVTATKAKAASISTNFYQNSGFVAGGIEAAIGHIVGTGLRLNAKIDHEALGISEDDARDINRRLERAWQAYSSNPLSVDAAGRHDVHQLARIGMRGYFLTGEILATMEWIQRGSAQTKVNLIDSNRLSRTLSARDRVSLQDQRDGIECDEFGFIERFHIDQDDGLSGRASATPVPVDQLTSWGRRKVIFLTDPLAPGVQRGISPLASVASRVADHALLQEATLKQAQIQSLIGAVIKSDLPSDKAFDALIVDDANDQSSIAEKVMNLRTEWHSGGKPLDLADIGRVVHLYANENLELVTPKAPGNIYEDFARCVLQEIARGLGLSYEAYTGDYSKSNYSSSRQALNEMWRIIEIRRRTLAVPFYKAIYENWLEEMLDAGRIQIPEGAVSFEENREAWINAQWIGVAKPSIDTLKETKAAEIALNNNFKSLSQIIAEDSGSDSDEVLEQRSRERKQMKQLELPLPAPSNTNGMEFQPTNGD